MSGVISVQCPNCDAKLQVQEPSGTSKKVRCPKCKETFVVEAPEEEEAPSVARKRRTPAAAEPDDGDDDAPPAGKKRRTPPADDDEEEPRPGKKKKKKKEKEKSGRFVPLLIGLAAVCTLALLGAIVVGVMQFMPGKLTAPESYGVYEGPEYEFSLQYPSGWKLKDGGLKNSRTVSIEKGSASIRLSQGLMSSVIGDIVDAAQPDPSKVSDDRLPVSVAHERKKEMIAEEVGGKYREEPATTVMTKGFGKARRSAFFTSQGLSKIRGYRATVLGHMISYDIICQCAESDWAVAEPAFAKVIESLGPGGAHSLRDRPVEVVQVTTCPAPAALADDLRRIVGRRRDSADRKGG